MQFFYYIYDPRKIKMKKISIKFLLSHILRALLCYALFVIVSSVTIEAFCNTFEVMLSDTIFTIGSLLAVFLSLQSFIRVFYEFDFTARESFLEISKRPDRFFTSCKNVALSPEFITETLCMAVLICFTPTKLFADLIHLLFSATTIGAVTQKLIILSVMIPFTAAVQLIIRVSVRKNWLSSRIASGNAPRRIFEYLRFVGKIILICYIYPIGFMIIPFVLAASQVAWFFVKSFFPTIIAIIAIIAVFRYARAAKIRKKLLKNLKNLCTEQNFELSEIKNPYSFIFFPIAGANFTVTAHGKTYCCKLLGSVSRGARIVFDAQGNAVFVHTLKFKKVELLHYTHRTDYSFESENDKILIVCPTPLELFVGEVGKTREIDIGEAFWGYKVYNSTGFLRSLELDCIEVHSKYQ